MFRKSFSSGRLLATLCFAVLAAISSSGHAAVFRNAYVSFEMPDNWKCALEQTEWVCRSEDQKQSKEAIIILTAKEVGPMDSYEAYINHLNTPQQVTYRNTGTTTSRIVYPPKRITVNDHQWIDGLHLGSEVPSYFTRYLATIKDRIAVLVTFSAHRNKYTEYSSAFFKAVNSLRVIANRNLLASPEMAPLRGASEALGGGISGAMPSDMMDPGDGLGAGAVSSGSGSTLKTILLVIAVLLAGGGVYVYLKSRR